MHVMIQHSVGLLPHDSPEETSAAPTGRLTSPATAEPALGSGFP